MRALGLALALAAGGPGTAQALQAPPAATPEPFEGVWDLTWETRKGPSRKGYMVIEQHGSALTAQIHGQGSVKATGAANGAGFSLRGRRMGTPYAISGRLEGGKLVGSLKVLTVDKRFTGARRP